MADEYTPQHAPEPVADTPKRRRGRADDGIRTVTVHISASTAKYLAQLRTILAIRDEAEHPIFDECVLAAIKKRVPGAKLPD